MIESRDPSFVGLADYPLPQITPFHTDLWWVIPQPDGSVAKSQLFPECKKFLAEAEALATYGKELVRTIHLGKPFTTPPRYPR